MDGRNDRVFEWPTFVGGPMHGWAVPPREEATLTYHAPVAGGDFATYRRTKLGVPGARTCIAAWVLTGGNDTAALWDATAAEAIERLMIGKECSMASMTHEEVEALPWQEVDSSNVGRVAFGLFVPADNDAGQTFTVETDIGDLYVEFLGSAGRIYRYEKVRVEQHKELIEAESVGGYLNAEIKPSHVCERIELAVG